MREKHFAEVSQLKNRLRSIEFETAADINATNSEAGRRVLNFRRIRSDMQT